MRKCTVKMIAGETPVEAMFHQWTTSYDELNDGVGQYPVAIVEFADGKVGLVPAPFVQFLPQGGMSVEEWVKEYWQPKAGVVNDIPVLTPELREHILKVIKPFADNHRKWSGGESHRWFGQYVCPSEWLDIEQLHDELRGMQDA